jgi:hypothetical protein
MDNNSNMTTGKNVCRCGHHNAFPVLIVLFGLSFLLEAMGVMSSMTLGYVWPILVIIGGFAKMGGHMCKCCNSK